MSLFCRHPFKKKLPKYELSLFYLVYICYSYLTDIILLKILIFNQPPDYLLAQTFDQ